MTKDQQRIAFWQWMGWKDCRNATPFGLIGTSPRGIIKSLPEITLDVLHEAKNKLRDNQFHCVAYPEELFKVVTGRKWDGDMGYFFFNIVNPTVEQELESLLRTVGMWKE